MFNRITIVGDGAMGCVCGMLLCNKGLDVTVWGHDVDQLNEMASAGENVKFLPGHKFPKSMKFQADDAKALAGTEMIVSAVPCQFMRGVWARLKPHLAAGIPVVSVTKGIENQGIVRPTEIFAQVLGTDNPYAVLSGPTIADEIAEGKPATASVACPDLALAEEIQRTFNSEAFRVYRNDDMIGVELAGALKNVIAIAAGIIDGVGAGDNAKAALLSRGLAEIKRLGLAIGAHERTFSGLSGLGDLVTTCISPHGRNRTFGEKIGKGMTAKEALGSTDSVVEGAATCRSALELAGQYNVEMPISQAVDAIITGKKNVKEAIHDLMSRQLKAE